MRSWPIQRLARGGEAGDDALEGGGVLRLVPFGGEEDEGAHRLPELPLVDDPAPRHAEDPPGVGDPEPVGGLARAPGLPVVRDLPADVADEEPGYGVEVQQSPGRQA